MRDVLYSKLNDFIESKNDNLTLTFNKENAKQLLNGLKFIEVMEDRMMEIRKISGMLFSRELFYMIAHDGTHDTDTCRSEFGEK